MSLVICNVERKIRGNNVAVVKLGSIQGVSGDFSAKIKQKYCFKFV